MTNQNIDTPTPDESTTTRPIGFWLRVVDAKISEQFDEAFAPEGVSRRDWMLLSMLDGDAAHPAFAERIARKAARGGRGRVREASDGALEGGSQGERSHTAGVFGASRVAEL